MQRQWSLHVTLGTEVGEIDATVLQASAILYFNGSDITSSGIMQ
jgi:hypothetical protein